MLANQREFAAHGPEPMQAQLREAERQLSSGATSTAAQLAADVLDRRPDSVLALELAAQAAQAAGDHEAACLHLEDLLLLQPDDAVVELMLASSLLALGRLSSARLFLQKAQAGARRLNDDATRDQAAELLATLTPRITRRLSEQWSRRLERGAAAAAAAAATEESRSTSVTSTDTSTSTSALAEAPTCELPATGGAGGSSSAVAPPAPLPPRSPAYPDLLARGGTLAAGAYYGGVDLTYPGLQAPAPRAPSTSLDSRDIPPSNRTHPPAALP